MTISVISHFLLQCAAGTFCYDQANCINFAPGFACASCPLGMTGDQPSGIGVDYALSHKQTCSDIDECALGEHICVPYAYCNNTIVSTNPTLTDDINCKFERLIIFLGM